ncbi:MAG TPA: 3-deoxy-D-manno-octulosonic acid transferase [Planctomycetes bacterium]|nr:3-deoxy-D-manno-octulosonic acid transferase [Planctomycetota bacterium]
MSYLLNLVYLIVLVVASPWFVYNAIRKGKYRQGWGEKFFGRVPRRSREQPGIWLHAVSVGEVNLLQPLLAAIENKHPDWECVISTTTRTGYELARQKYAPRSVFYCPLDFSWAVRAALRRIHPQLLVLVELELWPNLIHSANRLGVPVAVINGRLSASSARGYARIPFLMRRLLRATDLLAVQNEEYAERFRQLGANPDQLHVTGSLKFDGIDLDRNNPATRKLATLARLTDQNVVFLAGSTQHPEEQLALSVYQELVSSYPQLRLILVPRHPERFPEVATMLDQQQENWQRRSELNLSSTEPPPPVLLVDVMGELAAWWGTAQIAFVGGSLGKRGGQNMIEPSGYGAAVCFGPHTHNFRDIVDMLLQQEAAVVIRDKKELKDFVQQCLDDPESAQQLGQRAQQFVAIQNGATERTLLLLESLCRS